MRLLLPAVAARQAVWDALGGAHYLRLLRPDPDGPPGGLDLFLAGGGGGLAGDEAVLEGLAAGVWSRGLSREAGPFAYWLALYHVATVVLGPGSAPGSRPASAAEPDTVEWSLRPLAQGFGEWADPTAVRDLVWVPAAPAALAELMRGAPPAAARSAPREVADGRARRLLSVFPSQGAAAGAAAAAARGAAEVAMRAREKVEAALRGPTGP
jgi:hypothetical protein